jgi:hypothetical protein
MLLSIIFNFITILTLIGYALFLKKILTYNNSYKSEYFKVENLDIFYGFIFLIFISLVINFFSPLKYFTHAVVILGLVFFIYGLYKKFFNLNFLLYFFIIFFITFISFNSRDNVDSPMYHLQIIKWMVHNKINFGIANLEVRLGFNSSWHSFIALLDLNFRDFSNKFYISSVFFSFIIYEFLQKKKKYNYSDYFLCLVICYLFLFSYLHPFYYGVVLNHLGNPERDIVSMLLYFFVIYLFMKINENDIYPSLSLYEKNNLINIFFISVFFCITTREATLPILILFFYVFFHIKNFKKINYVNIFIFVVGILWITRSFILSGCFIFPITQSCVSTFWSVDVEIVNFLVEEAMRYSRTLPLLEKVNDFNFTLYSYNWLLPWFKNYFLEAALLQIGSVVVIFFLLLIILRLLQNKLNKNNTTKFYNYEYIIFFTLLFHLIFWFRAPEIRYAWGLLFSLPVFFVVIFIKLFSINAFIKHKHLVSVFIIIFTLFFSKNIKNFSFQDFTKVIDRKYDFSNIQKIGTFNGVDIYFNYWQCADYKNVCVNIPRKDYKITKKLGYIFYESN